MEGVVEFSGSLEEQPSDQYTSDEQYALQVFEEQLKKAKESDRDRHVDDAAKMQPQQSVQHINETGQVFTNLLPPPDAVQYESQSHGNENAFHQSMPSCFQTEFNATEGYMNTYINTEVQFAPQIFDYPREVEHVVIEESGFEYSKQVLLPNAECLLPKSAKRPVHSLPSPGEKTAEICSGVKKLLINSPPITTGSRKRTKDSTTPTSIEDLKIEIDLIESDPNHDVEELKKKRNNLACRVHRMKKKKVEHNLGEEKSTLQDEVNSLKEEVTKYRHDLKKTNDFLVQLQKHPEMPPKLAKKIEKRIL